MTGDNLTKAKLFKYIGKNRFEDEEKFKDFLKPHIKEILAIPHDRLGEEATPSDDNRYDIYVYDKETLREILIIIGLKTAKKYPKFTQEDFEKLHSSCMDAKALYSVLMSETECHFFQYSKTETTTDIIKTDEVPSLNHIDYEFSKIITKDKLIDLAISRKWVTLSVILFIVFVMLLSIARAVYCSVSGPVKANINSKGEKIYYTPADKGYSNITIGDQPGERRFCGQQDAVNKGWVRAQ